MLIESDMQLAARKKITPFLLGAIFFFSGQAALTYQVVWQRLLSVYYGVGPISTSIVVSLFMLGLGVGALFGGSLSGKARSPVLIYVLIELGIGIFGSISLIALDVIGNITAGSEYVWMLLWVSIFLLVPTVLMGMTLPIVIRILQTIEGDNLKNTSFYYFVNTLGAAFGALFCSYILISLFGLDVAVSVAVTTNILLALVIFVLAAQYKSHERTEIVADGYSASIRKALPRLPTATLLFINGFMAIGYQIIWYRIAGVILKDSIYSFSTVLFVYLLGIGLGSLWLNKRKRSVASSSSNFEVYLKWNAYIGLLAIGSVVAIYHLSGIWPLSKVIKLGHAFEILPYVGENAILGSALSWFLTQLLVFFWPAVLLLIPTFFMGATFPLGLTLLDSSCLPSSVSTGRAYAITILGNTLGGLITSFMLLPTLGTIPTLMGFAVLQASYLFFVRVKECSLNYMAAIAVGIATLMLLAPTSKDFYLTLHPKYKGYQSFFEEGIEGVVMTFAKDDALRNYINGSAHGGRPGYPFINEAFVALSHSKSPKKVLVIGYGTGSLTDAVLLDRRVENVTLVELNKTLIENVKNISEIRSSLANEKLTVVIEDGRRFLLRNAVKYDLILMNPLRSRSAYSNNIYSSEFFQMVSKHLSDDGVFLVWSDDKSYRLDATLAGTFEHLYRYKYFLVASKANTQSQESIYMGLISQLPVNMASNVRDLYSPPIRNREEILEFSPKRAAVTDQKPFMEYYLRSIFLGY